MQILIKDILVKDRFRKDLGDLSTLMQSMKEIGLLHPVVVQKDTKRLIAGGRRLQSAINLGWEHIEVTIIKLNDIVKGEFEENTARKNFTLTEAVEIVEFTVNWMTTHPEDAYKSPTDGAKRVRENAAKFMNISHGQLGKMMEINKVVTNNPKKFGHVLEDIEGGQSINYAHNSLKNVIRQNTVTPDLPKGEFELIEADFPWDYDLSLLEGTPPYKTMKLDEIKTEIPTLPAYKDCILFMWVTNPKLEEGLELMKFYGFTYKTNMVWIKQKNGKIQITVGYYVRGAHELLLVGTKGSPGVPPEALRVPSVVLAPRGRHSVKPVVFTDIINKYYPKKRKISMFSRGRNEFHDETWKIWGLEANKLRS